MRYPPDLSHRVAFSPTEWARLLGVHPNTVNRRISDGTLHVVHFGSRILIPRSEFFRLGLLPIEFAQLGPLPIAEQDERHLM